MEAHGHAAHNDGYACGIALAGAARTLTALTAMMNRRGSLTSMRHT
jgi:hypothetical protein